MPVIDVDFISADKNKAMHPAWKALKGKYAEVLKAKAIKFDKKMGPMLDKRTTLIKAIQGVSSRIEKPVFKLNLSELKKNAVTLNAAAETYLDRVGTLSNPAKKEFEDFLNTVKKAAENDQSWANSFKK